MSMIIDLEHIMGIGRYDDLNILVININLSTPIIICKNRPCIIITRSNTTSILYFFKTIFKDYTL